MKKELTKLEIGCESIRKDIKECGKLYITVAYKVYELYIYGVYKEKYRNIVDCCKEEFGFKKSTTYNMIKIVTEYGEEEDGVITYRSLMKFNKFSYSQLSEMLSLSDGQRTKVTPDTTVLEIRKIKSEKKVQTSGKIEEVKVPGSEPEVIEVLPEQFQVEKVQTSGKKVEEIKVSESEPEVIEVFPEQFEIIENTSHSKLVQQQLELYNNDVEKTILGLIERINSLEFSASHFKQLYKESENKLRNLIEKSDAFRERLLKDEETIKSQSETISDYMKRNEKLIYRNSILETDAKMLRIKVQQLEEKISQLEVEKNQTF